MSDLRELYQELILDHSKRPRNYKRLEPSDRQAEGFNPLCGDHILVYLQMDESKVKEVGFQGQGCAICTSSASVMTEAIKGKDAKEAAALFERFHALVTGSSDEDLDSLGKLAVFAGVSEYPVRVKCASLPWHTLTAALKQQKDAITTE